MGEKKAKYETGNPYYGRGDKDKLTPCTLELESLLAVYDGLFCYVVEGTRGFRFGFSCLQIEQHSHLTVEIFLFVFSLVK